MIYAHGFDPAKSERYRRLLQRAGEEHAGVKALSKLQQIVVGPSLAVAGYSSKMPRAVVFGPKWFGGMNWEIERN